MIYQTGDGTSTNFTGDDGDIVYIDEYTPSGTLLQQFVMPSVTANGYNALTQEAGSTASAFVNATASGNGYVFGGVDYTLGAIPSGTTAPAVIAFLSTNGTLE